MKIAGWLTKFKNAVVKTVASVLPKQKTAVQERLETPVISEKAVALTDREVPTKELKSSAENINALVKTGGQHNINVAVDIVKNYEAKDVFGKNVQLDFAAARALLISEQDDDSALNLFQTLSDKPSRFTQLNEKQQQMVHTSMAMIHLRNDSAQEAKASIDKAISITVQRKLLNIDTMITAVNIADRLGDKDKALEYLHVIANCTPVPGHEEKIEQVKREIQKRTGGNSVVAVIPAVKSSGTATTGITPEETPANESAILTGEFASATTIPVASTPAAPVKVEVAVAELPSSDRIANNEAAITSACQELGLIKLNGHNGHPVPPVIEPVAAPQIPAMETAPEEVAAESDIDMSDLDNSGAATGVILGDESELNFEEYVDKWVSENGAESLQKHYKEVEGEPLGRNTPSIEDEPEGDEREDLLVDSGVDGLHNG